MPIEIRQPSHWEANTVYPRLTELINADRNMWDRMSEDVAREVDESRSGKYVIRLIAVDGDRRNFPNSIVGTARLSLLSSGQGIGRCDLDIIVDPHRRRSGIGSSLYNESIRLITGYRCPVVEGDAQSKDALDFCLHRGFRTTHHEIQLVLKLPSTAERQLDSLRNHLQTSGFHFLTLDEFMSSPNFMEKMAKLNDRCELAKGGAGQTFHDMNELRRLIMFRRNALEGFFAVKDEELVGMSIVQYPYPPGSAVAYNRVTAVDPDYQQRGIGKFLKLLAVEYAQGHGASCIWTAVLETNMANIKTNESVGYVQGAESYHVALNVPLDHDFRID